MSLYNIEPVALLPIPRLTDVGLIYWLDNVSCNGTESKLSECEHNGVGVHRHCLLRYSEAGVLCSCKFAILLNDLCICKECLYNNYIQLNVMKMMLD